MAEYLLVFLVLAVAVVGGWFVWQRMFRKSGTPATSTLYTEALRDLLDGRDESAFTKLRQVVTEDSTNLDAYLRLGRILREHDQAKRALQVHKDLTVRRDLGKQDKLAILREIALDAAAMDDVKMAEDALQEMVALDPSNHWAHTRYLGLLEKARRWDEAYDIAATLIKIEAGKSKKPLAKFKFQSGELLYRKREYHKARILYKEAIGLDPNLVEAYLAIGDSYYEEKRLEDAVTFWTKLISAVPDKAHRVINRLEKTFFDLGRFGDIQGICEIILDHSPRNFEARLALAKFYEKKSETDMSAELLERLVDDHPLNMLGVLELMRTYLERNDSTKLARLVRNLERKREEQAKRPADGSTGAAASQPTS